MGGSVSTSAKQIFLKYYKQNREFLLDEQETDFMFTNLISEINFLPLPDCPGNNGLATPNTTWKELLPEWTNDVRKRFKNSLEHSEMVYLSAEDLQLINMDCLQIEASLMPIVKFLEDGIETVKELLDKFNGVGSSGENDGRLQDWEIELMDYMKRLIHKKKLFDYNRPHFIFDNTFDEMTDFFTDLELKVLTLLDSATDDWQSPSGFMSVPSELASLTANSQMLFEVCRVCCHHKPNQMVDIFATDGNPDGLSYATKIGMCVDLPPIDDQDTLPKSICRDCVGSLGTCYEFQKLCRDSDFELRRDKTLRDLIMEQVLDKTMGSGDGTSPMMNDTLLLGVDSPEMTAVEEETTTTDVGSESPDSDVHGRSIKTTTNGDDEICDIRKFQCEICGARFFDIYNFKTHFRIHKIVKKYECTECGKKFRTNVMLKIHTRTHTGERPFACEKCGKCFKTASAVTSHQAVHATVKAFKCDLCPYEGTTKPNLRIHQRTHSKEQPYACNHCGKRFSTASNLLKHSRNIHQQLKTNMCPLCDKKFFSRESARKHLITHTDCKPYECKHCPSCAYSWYSGLEKHYQKYHKRARMPAESSFKERVDLALVELEQSRPQLEANRLP